MSDDYLKHAEAVLKRMNSTAKNDVSLFSRFNADNFQRIQGELLLVAGITATLVLVFFFFLLRSAGVKNYQKVKKERIVPGSSLGFAAGSCLWLFGHGAACILSLLMREDAAAYWYPLVLFTVNYFLITSAVVCIALNLDFNHSSTAMFCVCITSVIGSMSAASEATLAGVLGVYNVVVAVYWTFGLCRSWLRKEIRQTMKEIKEWDAPLKEKDAKRQARLAKRK